jgi:hypothetical protein
LFTGREHYRDAPQLIDDTLAKAGITSRTSGECKANTLCYAFRVDEGRKRVLMIAATILCARKLAQFDKPCPGIESAIANGIAMAEKIMAKIDAKFPTTDTDSKAPYRY